MKLLISVSSTPSTIIEHGNSLVITLEPIEKRPKRKTLFYTYKSVPCAILIKDFVWDEGTEDAKVYPALDMISVPKKMREGGLGMKLLRATLKAMRSKKIPSLMFVNYAEHFWDAAQRALPKNVRFESENKRIGYLEI